MHLVDMSNMVHLCKLNEEGIEFYLLSIDAFSFKRNQGHMQVMPSCICPIYLGVLAQVTPGVLLHSQDIIGRCTLIAKLPHRRVRSLSSMNAILNNSKLLLTIGELAQAFMRYLCMGGALRAIFSSNQLPCVFDRVEQVRDECFGFDVRGTFLSDMTALDDFDAHTKLPPESDAVLL